MIFSTLVSGSSAPGQVLGVVFLGKTLYPQWLSPARYANGTGTAELMVGL